MIRTLLLCLFILHPSSLILSAERPNIVFLFTDDQRWDCMGCMGNESIITPHLDRLAEDGTLFTNAFHAVPICEPSRATIMLGQYLGTHRSGFDRPTDFTISRAEFANSYPVLLRAAGYRTAFVGKWGFAVTDEKIPNVTYNEDGSRNTESQIWKQDAGMPMDAFDVWNGFPGQGSYQVKVGNTTIHGTEHRGNQAVAFIEDCAKNHPDQPFVVQVSFKASHSPMQPDKRHLALYKDIEIPEDEASGQEHFDRLPETVRNNYRGARKQSTGGNALKNYYGLITGVDEVVGRIRKTLEDLELSENTVIIYTSDNGYFNGYKRLSGKDLLYEPSLRSPLIVLDPRVPRSKPGRRVAGLVSSVDIAPTLLALGGVEAPETMQGVSIVPLFDGKTKSVRDHIFAENHFSNFQLPAELAATPEEKAAILARGSVRSKCVRTAKWKYIRYFETEPIVEELFAIDKDPTEFENLAANPEYADALAEMRKRCDELIKETAAK